jgi:8-oxo-dGTP pyrophosphatase MutT (NUDIX family)
MSSEGWRGLVGGLLEFFAEEAKEPEHVAEDAEFKESDHPRKDDGKFGSGSGSSKKEPGSETARADAIQRYLGQPEDSNAAANREMTNKRVVAAGGKPLSALEMKVARGYMGYYSPKINDGLRVGANPTKDQQVVLDTMDSALSKLPSYKGEVTRGVKALNVDDVLKKYKPGEIVTEKAYSSAKEGSKLAANFNDANVAFSIKSNGGAKRFSAVSAFGKDEQEVIFPRNSRFKVESVKKEGKRYKISMSEVVGGAKDSALDAKVRAAGLILQTPDGAALFLKRSETGDHEGEWCWPGGQLEGDEKPLDAALREAREETGWIDDLSPEPDLVDEKDSDGVVFTTFKVKANNPFIPTLDDEHVGWAWAPLSDPPQPLHPGCEATLAKIKGGGAEDAAAEPTYHVTQLGSTWRYYFIAPGKMTPHEMSRPYKSKAEAEIAAKNDVEGLKKNLGKDAAANEATKSELKSEIQFPPEKATGGTRAINIEMKNGGVGKKLKYGPGVEEYTRTGLSNDQSIQWFALEKAILNTKEKNTLATDESNRTFDLDGRMHVNVTNISKSNVCDYLGSEIPDYEKLGLDRNKIYKLLRDPDELRKAAPTFNGIQVLMRHVPVSAEDHQPWDIVGTTGTDAVFEEPYLKNSLVLWAQRAIDAVESEDQKELSSAYHYRPIMEGGSYNGVKFDGRMVEIIGNHVAVIREGRVGHDVCVADSAENLQWRALDIALRRFAYDDRIRQHVVTRGSYAKLS